METARDDKSNEGVEKEMHLPETAAADDTDDDESLCFSDAEDRSWRSPYNSNCAGSSFEEGRPSCALFSEIGCDLEELSRCSSASDCSQEIDLEMGVLEVKADRGKPEKDCRICQLSLEGTPESGAPIDLGCSCKHDLGAAHKQCAETWFKIKGNKICEICGSTAKNVIGAAEAETVEQWNETSSNPPPTPPAEPQSFWQGHRFLNFLLACMVFAFVISWLFHFNVPG